MKKQCHKLVDELGTGHRQSTGLVKSLIIVFLVLTLTLTLIRALKTLSTVFYCMFNKNWKNQLILLNFTELKQLIFYEYLVSFTECNNLVCTINVFVCDVKLQPTSDHVSVVSETVWLGME